MAGHLDREAAVENRKEVDPRELDPMDSHPRVVAIDGPSGVGKSTVAARVAEQLGLPWLETGAMYRALGWRILEEGIDPADRRSVEALARDIDLQLVESSDHRVDVLLDGKPSDAVPFSKGAISEPVFFPRRRTSSS